MKTWSMSILFATGILLAGSDGAYFPYPNFVGVLLILASVALSQEEN